MRMKPHEVHEGEKIRKPYCKRSAKDKIHIIAYICYHLMSLRLLISTTLCIDSSLTRHFHPAASLHFPGGKENQMSRPLGKVVKNVGGIEDSPQTVA